MQKKTKIILIVILLLILGALIYYQNEELNNATYRMLGDNDLGTVEKIIYGNESANNTIALITGIHQGKNYALILKLKQPKNLQIKQMILK